MAKDPLEKDLESQRKHTAEMGRTQSARTGQVYQEVGGVPLSDEAEAHQEALVEASVASHAEFDAPAKDEPAKKADKDDA